MADATQRSRRTRACRPRPAAILGTAVALAGCGGAGDAARTAAESDPVELRWRLADGQSVTYVASIEQEITWMSEPPTVATRELSVRYTVTGGEAGRATVRIDTAGSAFASPHGVEQLDTRNVLGKEIGFAISAPDGLPIFADEVPGIQAGALSEVFLPISDLLEYGFVGLPDGPVAVGDRWTRSREAHRVEGMLRAPARLTTEYRLAGWEERGGVTLARIETTTSGEVAAEGEQHEQPITHESTIAGSATILFDRRAGVIVEIAAEEASDGGISGTTIRTTPIQQQTTVTIRRQARGASS